MTHDTPRSPARSFSLLVSLSLAALLLALGIGFRTHLVAWFAGSELKAPAATPHAPTAAATGSHD